VEKTRSGRGFERGVAAERELLARGEIANERHETQPNIASVMAINMAMDAAVEVRVCGLF
jgi:hypothetical protein